MRYGSFIVRVDQLGHRLASTAEAVVDEPVPTCPGWTVRDVVRHVAEVYEHKIACTELQRSPDPWPPAWPDRDPIDWLRDAHARLLAMFHTHEPADPSATWWPADQTVGFWARRMAHETAIHGVDAELAAGRSMALDAELAVDGIDEILTIMLAGDWSDAPSAESVGRRVAVASEDRTWVVTLDRLSTDVVEGTADDVSTTVAGEPSSVDLWLWGRASDDAIEMRGSADEIQLLRSRLALATQ